MTSPEPPVIAQRLTRLERTLGGPVLLRAVRVPEPGFRGRICRRRGATILEYRDGDVGYFWHYAIIEELLDLAEAGWTNVVLHDDGSPRARPVREQ